MSCLVADVDAAGDVVEQHHVAARRAASGRSGPSAGCRPRACRPPGRSAAGSGSGGARRSARRAAISRRRRTIAAAEIAAGIASVRLSRTTSAAAGPRSCGPRGRARCRDRRGSRRRGLRSRLRFPPTRISPPLAFRAPNSVMKSSRWPWPARPPMPRISPRRSSSETPFTPVRAQVAHLERHRRRPPAAGAGRDRCGRSCGRSSASPPRPRRSCSRVATYSPLRKTVIRSAMSTTSPQRCDVKMTQRASLAQRAHEPEEPLDLALGERRGRLVEEEDLRLGRSARTISIIWRCASGSDATSSSGSIPSTP